MMRWRGGGRVGKGEGGRGSRLARAFACSVLSTFLALLHFRVWVSFRRVWGVVAPRFEVDAAWGSGSSV